MVKMHQKGFQGHLWRVINKWYTSSSSCILWSDQHSSSFIIKQSMQQGGILFPFLYCIFLDELLDTLAPSGAGVMISGIYSGSPTYADDISLIADSPTVLQLMLDLVDQYAKKWRYQLKGIKSVVMVFGKALRTRERERARCTWKLGESFLREVDEQHHLGMLRSVANSTVSHLNERATAARSVFFALNSVGPCFGCLHPLTSLKLYQSLCLPLLLYGSELWCITKTELMFLERVHRKILRTMQDLPTRCPSSSLTTLMGMQSVDTLIQQRSLGFVMVTANLPSESIARRVLVARAGSSSVKGVVRRFQDVLAKHSLPDLSTLLSNTPSSNV